MAGSTGTVNERRRRKFRQVSQKAVGAGLRQAHNAGRGHGKYSSVNTFEAADTEVFQPHWDWIG